MAHLFIVVLMTKGPSITGPYVQPDLWQWRQASVSFCGQNTVRFHMTSKSYKNMNKDTKWITVYFKDPYVLQTRLPCQNDPPLKLFWQITNIHLCKVRQPQWHVMPNPWPPSAFSIRCPPPALDVLQIIASKHGAGYRKVWGGGLTAQNKALTLQDKYSVLSSVITV